MARVPSIGGGWGVAVGQQRPSSRSASASASRNSSAVAVPRTEFARKLITRTFPGTYPSFGRMRSRLGASGRGPPFFRPVTWNSRPRRARGMSSTGQRSGTLISFRLNVYGTPRSRARRAAPWSKQATSSVLARRLPCADAYASCSGVDLGIPIPLKFPFI